MKNNKMSRKGKADKGVAIPYIIALILGIIVLGMVAYWFITTYGLGWLGFNEAFCRAQLSKYCEDLIAGKTSVDFFKDYAKGCEVFQGKAGWPAVSPTVDECPKWR